MKPTRLQTYEGLLYSFQGGRFERKVKALQRRLAIEERVPNSTHFLYIDSTRKNVETYPIRDFIE